MTDYQSQWRQQQQLRELENVAGELKRQRVTQQHQASLAQVVIDAENALKALRELAVHDRFGAGLKAMATLHSAISVRTEDFHEYEMKRAWSAVTQGLNELWAVVAANPSLGPRAQAVIAASGQLEQWRAFLGADPDARARELDAKVISAKNGRKNAKLLSILSLSLLPLTAVGLFMTGMLAAVVEIPKETIHAISTVLALVVIVAPLVGIVAAIQYFSSRSSITKAEENASSFRAQLVQFGVFQTRPDGGQLLDEVARNHIILKDIARSGMKF